MKENITDKIKTYEDAIAATKRPDVPDLSLFPEDMREYFTAQYKILVIAEALNEGWKPDWNNSNQRKWYPWFRVSSSGFAFCVTYFVYVYPHAGHASRLCFKSDKLADYAGKQFVDIWETLIQK
jgi:hypothetical protein